MKHTKGSQDSRRGYTGSGVSLLCIAVFGSGQDDQNCICCSWPLGRFICIEIEGKFTPSNCACPYNFQYQENDLKKKERKKPKGDIYLYIFVSGSHENLRN